MASSLTHAHSFLHAHACLDLNNDYVAAIIMLLVHIEACLLAHALFTVFDVSAFDTI